MIDGVLTQDDNNDAPLREKVACGCIHVNVGDGVWLVDWACPQHDPGGEVDRQVQRALDLELSLFLKRGRRSGS